MSDEHRIVMVDKEVAELIERLQKDLDRNANALDETTEWMGRLAPALTAMRAQLTEATALLQAAEAQIVAVRDAVQEVICDNNDRDEDALDLAERLDALLTPTTSPDAGEGTKCGVTAWNRWSLPCDREPGHTGTHSHDPTPGRGGK